MHEYMVFSQVIEPSFLPGAEMTLYLRPGNGFESIRSEFGGSE